MHKTFQDLYGIDISAKLQRANLSLDQYYLPYATAAPFLKHGGFSEEAEVRISVVVPRSPLPNESRKPKPILFRNGQNNTLTPYIQLFTDHGKKLPIRSVIVGPHQDQDAQLYAATYLLQQCGYDVPVRKSDIPFRI
jgi:hypothetical protein